MQIVREGQCPSRFICKFHSIFKTIFPTSISVTNIFRNEECINMALCKSHVVKLVCTHNAGHTVASYCAVIKGICTACDTVKFSIGKVCNLVAEKCLISVKRKEGLSLVPCLAGNAVVSICKEIVALIVVFLNHSGKVNISVAVGCV